MTIGIVLSRTPAYSETFFISKIIGLQKSGHRVILFVQHKDDDFDLCDVKVSPRVYKRNPLFQVFSTLKVALILLPHYHRIRIFTKLEKQANRSNTQVFKNIFNNSHLLTSNLDWLHFGFATMALQSENVAKSINSKMAVSFRGFDLDVYPLKHKGCYNLLWKRVDKVHSISNYLLKKSYSLGMPNSINSQVITPAVDAHNLMQYPKAFSNKLQLLTIARLHWMKGIEEVLEALSFLKKQGIDFQYKIIGTGPEYEYLVFTVHQLGLNKEVELLGIVEHEQVKLQLLKTDIYIQYSYSEGFCNAALEAQAAGCLTIVSDGGGLTENVLVNETGFVVPKRNPKQLADTLLKVINLPEAVKQGIIRNAQKRVLTDFSIEKQQKEFKEFYESSID